MLVDAWAYSALLYWTIWSRNHTFLHIPKTGGSVIEALDGENGRELLTMLPKVLWKRWWAAPRNASGCPCSASNTSSRNGRNNAQTACLMQLWHLTPTQLDHCGMPTDANPYLRPSQSAYCIMREPVERFVSDLLYEETVCRRYAHSPAVSASWKRARSACVGRPCPSMDANGESRPSLSEITPALIRCFARFALDAASNDQRSELLSHLMPQSRYIVSDDGKPTCTRVFRYEDVIAARIVSGGARPHKHNYVTRSTPLAAHALSLVLADEPSMTILRRIYQQDFRLWDRVSRRQAPTPEHESLEAAAEALQRSVPAIARAAPNCSRPHCTCASRCCKKWFAASPRMCMSCHLSNAQCGPLMPGRQPKELQLPRAVWVNCQPFKIREWNWLKNVVETRRVACNARCPACCRKNRTELVVEGARKYHHAWKALQAGQDACDACDARCERTG